MVKFSKQMELQLVPEWRHKFCDYWQLKKDIKSIKLQRQVAWESPRGPPQVPDPAAKKLAAVEGSAWTPLTSFTRRTMHTWAHEDIIKVQQRKLDVEDGVCGGEYETQFVEGIEVDELERNFLQRLDQELNKVNHFFGAKEHEFLERAQILSHQLESLTEINQAYNNTMAQMSNSPPTHLEVACKNSFSQNMLHLKASTPSFLGSLFGKTMKAKGIFSSSTFSTSCGHLKCKKGGMESEENSRHPLNQHGPTNDALCDDLATQYVINLDGKDDLTNQYVIGLDSKDLEVARIHTYKGEEDMQDTYVLTTYAKSDDINTNNTNALYDGEEDWALDGLFNKEFPTYVTKTTNTNVASKQGKCDDNPFSNTFEYGESPSMGTSARLSISSLISTLNQRFWEGPKKEEKETYVETKRKNKAFDQHSLTSQSSFKTNMASMRRALSMSIESKQLYLDENCVSLRKIKHARKMLRTAFVEFYRGLGLLQTFSSLNILAFAKILKKYDKVTGRQISSTYMKVVEKAYFSTSDKVMKMMDEVERLFTEHFAKDDEKKAMLLLKPVQIEAPHTITFFLGLFSGSSIALLMAFAIIFHFYKLHMLKENKITYLETTYQVFGMLFLVLLHMYIYGWNVYAWRKARINYAFIFEFAPKTELRHREILLVCTGLTSIIVVGMLGHLVVYTSTGTPINSDIVPLITILALLLLLMCPLNVFYRSSRVYFLQCMKRVILSPLYKVLLADFFLADQLTSQVAALRSLQFVMCYYFGGFFQNHDTTACRSGEFRFLAYLISFLPYWWRLMQCLRRWIEEGDQAHLANGGKYLSAMVAVATRISYSFYPTAWWLVMFVTTSSFATLYQMYWDIVRDWGLLQPQSQNPWLRDQLVLKNKSTYYFSIALNFILRFAWLQQVTRWQIKGIEQNGTDLFFAALEVIRRGHWNFYRLENEHLNNVGKYRAVKLVPLPFRDDFDSHT